MMASRSIRLFEIGEKLIYGTLEPIQIYIDYHNEMIPQPGKEDLSIPESQDDYDPESMVRSSDKGELLITYLDNRFLNSIYFAIYDKIMIRELFCEKSRMYKLEKYPLFLVWVSSSVESTRKERFYIKFKEEKLADEYLKDFNILKRGIKCRRDCCKKVNDE